MESMRIACIAFAALLPLPLSVQAQKPTDIVKWSAKSPVASVKAGAPAKLEITADIADGWHLYALTQPAWGPPPLAIAIAKGQPFEIRKGAIVGPASAVAPDSNFGTETQYYEGKAVFAVPVTAKPAVRAGRHAVPIEVTFQACNNRMCLRPTTETVTAEISVK